MHHSGHRWIDALSTTIHQWPQMFLCIWSIAFPRDNLRPYTSQWGIQLKIVAIDGPAFWTVSNCLWAHTPSQSTSRYMFIDNVQCRYDTTELGKTSDVEQQVNTANGLLCPNMKLTTDTTCPAPSGKPCDVYYEQHRQLALYRNFTVPFESSHSLAELSTKSFDANDLQNLWLKVHNYLFIYICIYLYTCMCVYMYIYVYI